MKKREFGGEKIKEKCKDCIWFDNGKENRFVKTAPYPACYTDAMYANSVSGDTPACTFYSPR